MDSGADFVLTRVQQELDPLRRSTPVNLAQKVVIFNIQQGTPMGVGYNEMFRREGKVDQRFSEMKSVMNEFFKAKFCGSKAYAFLCDLEFDNNQKVEHNTFKDFKTRLKNAGCINDEIHRKLFLAVCLGDQVSMCDSALNECNTNKTLYNAAVKEFLRETKLEDRVKAASIVLQTLKNVDQLHQFEKTQITKKKLQENLLALSRQAASQKLVSSSVLDAGDIQKLTKLELVQKINHIQSEINSCIQKSSVEGMIEQYRSKLYEREELRKSAKWDKSFTPSQLSTSVKNPAHLSDARDVERLIADVDRDISLLREHQRVK